MTPTPRSALSATPDGAHVVVIDDDPTIHALVVAMLKPLSLRISCATSGDEGLALARADAPRLFLLDNDMPTGTGLDVLAQLKADPAFAAVPVIMVTGSESNKTLAACFAAGAIDYIRKPFTPIELINTSRLTPALADWRASATDASTFMCLNSAIGSTA